MRRCRWPEACEAPADEPGDYCVAHRAEWIATNRAQFAAERMDKQAREDGERQMSLFA